MPRVRVSHLRRKLVSLGKEPCSKDCPAVTGRPFGSVTYCAMAEQERHLAFLAEHPDSGTIRALRGPRQPGERGQPKSVYDANGNRLFEAYDWRIKGWTQGYFVNDGDGYSHFEPRIPPHPDETDCCANFQCCEHKWKGTDMEPILRALAGAAQEPEGAVIPLVKDDDGKLHVLNQGPDEEM
jgi:hypothetical protein